MLGSSLGGWVAGTYLARAGLRVTLLEEACLEKRPPLLREPFALCGLEAGGPLQRVLRELALPLIEQRKLVPDPVALQVLLPRARVDLRAGRPELASELAAFGLANEALALRWLELVDEAGAAALLELRESARPSPGHGSLVRRVLERATPEGPLDAPLPSAPPQGLAAFVRALTGVLSHRAGEASPSAPALLLHALREGACFMPDAGEPFVDLLRSRLLALHGEIHSATGLSIETGRSELAVDTGRHRTTASGLVVATPRESLARAIADVGGEVPRWLRGAAPPIDLPQRLYRAERDALPVGLGRRAVIADDSGTAHHWLARHLDPHDERIEWLVASGPGVPELPPEAPLADLNPFPGEGIVAVDPGPLPLWDRDASEARFPAERMPSSLRARPPVIAVGPEIEPGLGLIGEVLRAREAALRLIDRLGARRPV